MKKPNIVLILTDQQSSTMMSCVGNKYLKTPAMDSLAENGVLFNNAYCANPVCIPSRFSIFTGLYPTEIGQRSNAIKKEISGEIPDYIKKNGIGYLLQEAGYKAIFGGKEHLPKMRATDLGFDYFCEDERDELATSAAKLIKEKHDKPYCLVVSLINPHDICFMAIAEYAKTRDLENTDNFEQEDWFLRAVMTNGIDEQKTLEKSLKLPEGVSKKEFFEKHCPPLPPNFEIQDEEPDAIWAIKEQRQFKQYAHKHFTEEQWRMHRWSYAKLTEKVDGQIAKVLDAIKESGEEDNTVVMFSSDHGDMDSAHRMEHKTALYEEATHVPFIIKDPNMPNKGSQCNNFISNGLDIIPTICEYAGIKKPEYLKGASIKPLLENQDTKWRDSVYVEAEFGNMIVTDRYKYALYDKGENREQLYDLELDPYEMKNFANSADHQDILCKLRKKYKEFL